MPWCSVFLGIANSIVFPCGSIFDSIYSEHGAEQTIDKKPAELCLVPMQTPIGMFRLWLITFASRLRFPRLVALTAGLFLIDLIVPDMIPFVDEILLALLAALLSTVKKRKAP